MVDPRASWPGHLELGWCVMAVVVAHPTCHHVSDELEGLGAKCRLGDYPPLEHGLLRRCMQGLALTTASCFREPPAFGE